MLPAWILPVWLQRLLDRIPRVADDRWPPFPRTLGPRIGAASWASRRSWRRRRGRIICAEPEKLSSRSGRWSAPIC